MTRQEKLDTINRLNSIMSECLEFMDYKLKKFASELSQMPTTDEPKQEKEINNEKAV